MTPVWVSVALTLVAAAIATLTQLQARALRKRVTRVEHYLLDRDVLPTLDLSPLPTEDKQWPEVKAFHDAGKPYKYEATDYNNGYSPFTDGTWWDD